MCLVEKVLDDSESLDIIINHATDERKMMEDVTSTFGESDVVYDFIHVKRVEFELKMGSRSSC